VARSKVEWGQARAAYVRGEGPLREIAKRFKLSASAVMKRAAKEKWEADRAQAMSKARAKADESAVESLAAMLAKHRRIAALGLKLAVTRLEKEAELQEASDGHVDSETVDVLTKVVARLVPVERLAAGIERIKPVKPVEMADDDEIVFEIDAPTDAEEAAPALPPAVTAPALPARAPVKVKA
jgi:transposase